MPSRRKNVDTKASTFSKNIFIQSCSMCGRPVASHCRLVRYLQLMRTALHTRPSLHLLFDEVSAFYIYASKEMKHGSQNVAVVLHGKEILKRPVCRSLFSPPSLGVYFGILKRQKFITWSLSVYTVFTHETPRFPTANNKYTNNGCSKDNVPPASWL